MLNNLRIRYRPSFFRRVSNLFSGLIVATRLGAGQDLNYKSPDKEGKKTLIPVEDAGLCCIVYRLITCAFYPCLPASLLPG